MENDDQFNYKHINPEWIDQYIKKTKNYESQESFAMRILYYNIQTNGIKIFDNRFINIFISNYSRNKN